MSPLIGWRTGSEAARNAATGAPPREYAGRPPDFSPADVRNATVIDQRPTIVNGSDARDPQYTCDIRLPPSRLPQRATDGSASEPVTARFRRRHRRRQPSAPGHAAPRAGGRVRIHVGRWHETGDRARLQRVGSVRGRRVLSHELNSFDGHVCDRGLPGCRRAAPCLTLLPARNGLLGGRCRTALGTEGALCHRGIPSKCGER